MSGDGKLKSSPISKTSFPKKSTLHQIYNQSPLEKDMDESDCQTKSPTKTTEEQKLKLKKQKKAEMLKLFETNDGGEQETARENSPTTQAMSNSLVAMGNPDKDVKYKAGRYSEFGKATVSKFNMPLANSAPTRIGKFFREM